MDEHILALPENVRAVVEFEEAAEIMSTFADLGHHEESDSLQQHFAKDVTSLLEVMWTCGNPFLKESGPYFITLDTKEVIMRNLQRVFSMLLRKKNNCIISMLQTV